jgi:hypothetical protein
MHEVAHHGGEQLIAVGHPQGVSSAADARRRRIRTRVGTDRTEQALPALDWTRRAHRDPAQSLDRARVPSEMVMKTRVLSTWVGGKSVFEAAK